MEKIRKITSFILILTVLLCNFSVDKKATVQAENQIEHGLRGIYCLDSSAGTYRDANIRNYPFIEGYAWRPRWSDMDTAKGYDFKGVDHIIGKLEPIGKKLNMCVIAPEPEYLRSDETIQRWYDNFVLNGAKEATGWRPVPWEPKALDALHKFAEALATHKVYSTVLGKYVQLREHPVLTGISFSTSAIRDPFEGTAIVKMPGYSRDKYKSAVMRSLHAVTDNFPDKVGYLGFWSIKNDGGAVELWEDVRISVLAEFDGIKNPKVGIFSGKPGCQQVGHRRGNQWVSKISLCSPALSIKR